MQVIWITGANGFLGRHLAQRLGSSGVTVGGIGRPALGSERSEALQRHHIQDGAIDLPSLDRLAERTGRPDRVFHCAGGRSVGDSLANPLADFRDNVASTAVLAEWVRCNAPEAAIIGASSAAVYGNGHVAAIDEHAAAAPFSPYGFHKFAMEQVLRGYAQAFGLRVSIVRLFSIYGEGLAKQLLWDICRLLKAGRTEVALSGTGLEVRDWLHADDAADLLVAAADLAGSEPTLLNGGTGAPVTVRSIAQLVLDAWPAAGTITFSGQGRPGDPASLYAATDRLHAIGFRSTVTPAEGVARYVAWFRGLNAPEF